MNDFGNGIICAVSILCNIGYPDLAAEILKETGYSEYDVSFHDEWDKRNLELIDDKDVSLIFNRK